MRGRHYDAAVRKQGLGDPLKLMIDTLIFDFDRVITDTETPQAADPD